MNDLLRSAVNRPRPLRTAADVIELNDALRRAAGRPTKADLQPNTDNDGGDAA